MGPIGPGSLLSEIPCTPWLLELVTTRTRSSPFKHFFDGLTKRMLPLSGLLCLIQRLIVPSDRFWAAWAGAETVSRPMKVRHATKANASPRNRAIVSEG
jgi:hypothetical protein